MSTHFHFHVSKGGLRAAAEVVMGTVERIVAATQGVTQLKAERDQLKAENDRLNADATDGSQEEQAALDGLEAALNGNGQQGDSTQPTDEAAATDQPAA